MEKTPHHGKRGAARGSRAASIDAEARAAATRVARALLPQDSPAGDRRDAILDAALELFAERGFHGTAVPLIAERASVGAGTIYRYFASKKALVNALYQRWKGQLGRVLLEDFPFAAPPRQQLHAFWRRMARFATDHPRAFTFLELHHHAPYLDRESRALETRILDAARGFFQLTSAQELTKPLAPELLGAIVWGAFVGLVKASMLGHLVLSEAMLDAGEQCCWEAIRR